MRRATMLLAGVLIAGNAWNAAAAEKLRIGFIGTFAGPGGVLGDHMKKGVGIALDHLGSKVGGLTTDIIYRDDHIKPDVGLQVATNLVEREKVHFVSGVIWSHVMLAVAPYVARNGVLMVGAVGGPARLAGAACMRNVFVVSNQTAQGGEAMGNYLAKKGASNVYLMAPGYAAGRDILGGFKRRFKGKIVAEKYTKIGQMDFQAELSQVRAAKPKAVVVFYPGAMGIRFVTQYAQIGLREKVPLYSIYTVDHITLPAQRDAALGNHDISFWNHDLPNPRNRRFVKDFTKKYGHLPSLYAATSYDAIMMINHAVRSVKGNLKNRAGMIAAMEKAKAADFGSLRESFSFNTNHFPIQDFYVLRMVKGDGGKIVPKTVGVATKAAKDSFYKECKMK